MRATFRIIVTILATVLGAGTLSPLIGANWQEWAKTTGNDQYFVKYGALVMGNVSAITQATWFVFLAGFFVGGAVCLWIDKIFRNGAVQSPSARQTKTATDIAHTLSLVGGDGILLGLDKKRKTSEIGFQLQNTSGIPLRWTIEDFTTSIDGHSNANIGGKGSSGVAPIGSIQKLYGGVIQYIPAAKKTSKGVAKICYQYGLATPDTPMLREVTAGVEIDINPDGKFRYTILEENDVEI